MVIQCRGCDCISFRRESVDDGSWEQDEEGNIVETPDISIYPYPKEAVRFDLDFSIPHEIRTIYRQSINCLNRRDFILAAAGFRCVVEAICNHMKIEGRTLESRINKLMQQGIITKNDRNRLHAIRFMGNDSVHLMKEHQESELMIVNDIIMGIINNLYIIQDKFDNLQNKPIEHIDDFLKALSATIKRHRYGDIVTLNNLIKGSRTIIHDDVKTFESQLIEKIETGEFKDLQLCSKVDGRQQQYKICLQPPSEE